MSSEAPRTSGLRARLGTVRMRTTAAATLVVGVALLMASIASIVTLRTSLLREVETAGRLRAADIAAALEEGTDAQSLDLGSGDESFVQVVDDSGTVLAASSSLSGLPPVSDPPLEDSVRVSGLPPERDEPYIVVATRATTDDENVTVLVGKNLDPVEDSEAIVARILAIGIPSLLLIVATTTWAVVGRALRFVESIRAQVAEISTSQLHRRVPDPPGNDEVSRLARTMNAMLTRLENEQIRQRKFVSDASHELRSPLATIRNQAEVALSHPEKMRLEELSKDVLEENRRLEKLVDDLLILARSDERAAPETAQPIDLDDLVLEEAQRLRGSTALQIDTGAVSGGRVLGAPAELRRVVRNLLDNAARHAASVVRLELYEDHDGTVLVVDDDGRGIRPEHRESIFQRFTRLDEARDRDGGGVGLGLAIVAGTIRAHRGTIEVTDAPGGGARFVIRFPTGAGK